MLISLLLVFAWLILRHFCRYGGSSRSDGYLKIDDKDVELPSMTSINA